MHMNTQPCEHGTGHEQLVHNQILHVDTWSLKRGVMTTWIHGHMNMDTWPCARGSATCIWLHGHVHLDTQRNGYSWI